MRGCHSVATLKEIVIVFDFMDNLIKVTEFGDITAIGEGGQIELTV